MAVPNAPNIEFRTDSSSGFTTSFVDAWGTGPINCGGNITIVVNENGSPTSMKVYRQKDGGGYSCVCESESVDGDGYTTYSVAPPTDNGIYHYKISLVNGEGEGAQSSATPGIVVAGIAAGEIITAAKINEIIDVLQAIGTASGDTVSTTDAVAGDIITATKMTTLLTDMDNLLTDHCYCEADGRTNSGCSTTAYSCETELNPSDGDYDAGDPITTASMVAVAAQAAQIAARCACYTYEQTLTCTCDDVCSCDPDCTCNIVCTCETNCDCEAYCSCEVEGCSCDDVCTCENTCTCNTDGCDCFTFCGCEIDCGCDTTCSCTSTGCGCNTHLSKCTCESECTCNTACTCETQCIECTCEAVCTGVCTDCTCNVVCTCESECTEATCTCNTNCTCDDVCTCEANQTNTCTCESVCNCDQVCSEEQVDWRMMPV